MNLTDIYVSDGCRNKDLSSVRNHIDNFVPESGVVPLSNGKGFKPPADLPYFHTDSLQAAREYVFGNLKEGGACPCCGQQTQIRGRTITRGMAKWLCSLVVKAVREPGKFFHVNEISSQGGGDYAKLLKWGLIETAVNTDPTKRTSGMFRPTRLGIDFAKGIVGVPSHVFVFNNRVWGKKLTQMKIADVKRFNWQAFKAAVFGS